MSIFLIVCGHILERVGEIRLSFLSEFLIYEIEEKTLITVDLIRCYECVYIVYHLKAFDFFFLSSSLSGFLNM